MAYKKFKNHFLGSKRGVKVDASDCLCQHLQVKKYKKNVFTIFVNLPRSEFHGQSEGLGRNF